MPEYPTETRTFTRHKRPDPPTIPPLRAAVTSTSILQAVYEELFPAVTKAEVARVLGLVWEQIENGMRQKQPIYIPRVGRLKPQYSQRGAPITSENYTVPFLTYRFQMRPSFAVTLPGPTVVDAQYLRNVRLYLKRKYGADPAAWPESYAFARP